jgi:hypothetical protein
MSALYARTPDDLYIALWDKVTKQSVHVRCHDFEAMEAYAEKKNAERVDAYFSVCPHPTDLGPGTHGKATDKVMVPFLWSDIDGRWGVHAEKNTPPDLEAVGDILRSVSLKPSFSVLTGGGVHAYWCLSEPLSTSSDLPARLTSALRARATERGWGGVDSVHGLHQVMRLPETFNWKGAEPVAVELVEA